MNRSVTTLLVLCVVAGSGCRGRRAVKAVGHKDATPEQPRLLAVGASVTEVFEAAADGCLSKGRGRLDLNIHCLPNFGSMQLSALSVDDPTIVSADLQPRPEGGKQNSSTVVLRALGVGRTTLRAKAMVGLFSNAIEVPLEVAEPDRVTLDSVDELLPAGKFTSGRAHAFHQGRELDREGLALLSLEGAGQLELQGKAWLLRTAEKDAGRSGRLTSRFDPSVNPEARGSSPSPATTRGCQATRQCCHRSSSG